MRSQRPEEEEANIVGHDGHVDMLQAAGSTHVGVRQPRPELASKTELLVGNVPGLTLAGATAHFT